MNSKTNTIQLCWKERVRYREREIAEENVRNKNKKIQLRRYSNANTQTHKHMCKIIMWTNDGWIFIWVKSRHTLTRTIISIQVPFADFLSFYLPLCLSVCLFLKYVLCHSTISKCLWIRYKLRSFTVALPGCLWNQLIMLKYKQTISIIVASSFIFLHVHQ